MNAEEYTPDDDQVKYRYQLDVGNSPIAGRTFDQAGEEFDRWIRQHDAIVRAEGHRSGYETARGDLTSGAFVGGPTYEALRDSFSGRQIAKEARAEMLGYIEQHHWMHTGHLIGSLVQHFGIEDVHREVEGDR